MLFVKVRNCISLPVLLGAVSGYLLVLGIYFEEVVYGFVFSTLFQRK